MPSENQRKKPTPHGQAEKEELGKLLRTARDAAGYTLDAAADTLGYVKQTISSWENGRNVPDALTMRRLARLYRTSVDTLLGQPMTWPFSMELHAAVSRLSAPDLHFVEVAVWSQMKMDVPAELHYYGPTAGGRLKAPEFLEVGAKAENRLKRTS